MKIDIFFAELKRRNALVLAPGDAEAVNQYAQFLSTVGQLDANLREIERAQQLDPLSPIIGVICGRPWLP